MATPPRDPHPFRGEEQGPFRIDVVAERAGDGDDAVTAEAAARPPGFPGGAPGDGIAGYARGQRNRMPGVATMREAIVPFPVVVEQAAVAQVGDPRAPDLPEMGERERIRADAQRRLNEVPGAFPRRSVMRRAQEHDRPDEPRPGVPGLDRVEEGASRHESAHAVGHDHQLRRPDGSVREKRFEKPVELASAGRDVTPRVVAQVDRRQAEVALERGAVVVPLVVPAGVVHAEAVRQQHEPSRGLREVSGESPRIRRERLTVPPQAHRDRQGIAAFLEVVAKDAVENRDEGFATRRGLHLAEERGELRESDVDAVPDEPGHAADPAVDEPRRPSRGPGGRRAERPRSDRDRPMQRLDQLRQPDGCLHRQPAEAAEVAGPGTEDLSHRRRRERRGEDYRAARASVTRAGGFSLGS